MSADASRCPQATIAPVYHLRQEELLALIAKYAPNDDNHPVLSLIDVRTPEEYFGLGHIPQSLLLPLDELPRRLGELDPAHQTVLICEHGVRSLVASEYLVHQGFQHIYNLSEGMASWTGPRISS